jgi:NAD+ synthase
MAKAKAEKIALWMRSRLSSAGARGFIVGLSGGIDSALVARLAQMAAPGAVTGVLLPCHSDAHDERDALLVASHFALPTMRMDLSPTFDLFAAEAQAALRVLPEQVRTAMAPQHGCRAGDPATPADPLRGRVPLANIKPRLRMTMLYFIANSINYLVAGTGNRSELAIGYFTKYGDGGADLLPIGHLLKRQVREMAKELGVPGTIIARPPSAGLWLGQLDEDEMGFTYAELERYVEDGPQAVSPALAMRIERLVRASDHKRVMPPIPDA